MIVPPPTIPCRAPRLLANVRSAAGGAAWKRYAEITAVGTARMSGLTGAARMSDDLARGRYAQRFEIAGMGPSAEVYDGRTVWSQDISGGVHALNAPFARKRAVTSAYLARRAYLDPPAAATLTCVGTQRSKRGNAVLLRVQPRGGIPAILSIDARTYLVDSVSERLPTTTSVTRYADYRQVDGLVLPFAIASGTLAEPENGFGVTVRRYALSLRATDRDFARPAARNPAQMLDGATSTTVPLRIEGRQLLVWASIDGHAPMPFILDTGGHAILTTQAARTLGLHGAGAGVSGGSGAHTVALQYASADSLRIGQARLRNQRFLVIPYPFSFYERGRKPPLAGILGLEIFERFAVRIDYGRKKLTLTPLQRYVHSGSGVAVPIAFQEDLPLTRATADGRAGLFGLDTGNAGTVILFGDFLKRTGLERAYPKGVTAEGHGTGGADVGRIVGLRSFAFAGRTFTNVPTFLTHMRSGSFSSWTEAGNFGYEVLARFVPTFDYANDTLYLDRSPLAHAPPRNRAGLAFGKSVPGAFDVEAVKPGSPAAQTGIVAGDRIVAVDGKDASWFSRADLYDLTTQPPGTRLRLRVVHGKTTKDVTLVLPRGQRR